MKNIRNFCIIAHIDHGKSTLADRMLELTGTIQKRDMKEQLLDQLDLERERGITIKLAPVRMSWRSKSALQLRSGQASQPASAADGQVSLPRRQTGESANNEYSSNLPRRQAGEARISQPSASNNKNADQLTSLPAYTLNLIDTPGHVDFAYEVSRSIAAVEGAVLLVDASQGVEAQTLSVLYAAMDHNLKIIPVVNKIDLPAAQPDLVADEIVKIVGCNKSEIIYASGKTGEGVAEILDAIVERIPNPSKSASQQVSPSTSLRASKSARGCVGADTLISLPAEKLSLRALIFDSVYDSYRGVIAYVRVFDGEIKKGDQILLMVSKSTGEALEVGYFEPKLVAHSPISTGEIGYIVTGFRGVAEARVGDTVTLKSNPADSPVPGYKEVLPVVFSSIYCADGADYPELKEAIEKLKLNDASLSFEPERSEALGFGFRCGFLGLLHLDIVRERLEREYNLSLVVSTPTVEYRVSYLSDLSNLKPISRPSDFPAPGTYREIQEPIVSLEIFTPKEFVGSIMDLVQQKRAVFLTMEYLDESRAILRYEIPLADVIIDLYDSLKSVSRGYASMNYELKKYQAAELEKVDILISEEKVDALSFITHKTSSFATGKRIVEKLKELIPRQNFEVKLQAAIGGKIIASERISAFKKDVIAKLYGGDVTRKNKLLDKQKKGKKKMKQIGKVEIPSDVFINVLRN